MPLYSLVMPIHNARSHLSRVLPPLRELGADWEIVLVDDGSTDGGGELAQELLPQARFVRWERARGPAFARNRGVDVCAGEVIVFLDSDVLASPEVIRGLAAEVLMSREFEAEFGAYDDQPDSSRPVSRFRNLLHHYVHQRCPGPVASFWSGFGAVRSSAFKTVGGFDQARFPQPSVEDVELGGRLWRSGYRTMLNPRWQVKHLKDWTFSSFVRTDIFQRARPWTGLILQGEAVSNNLNLKRGFLGPVFVLALFLATLLGSGYNHELTRFMPTLGGAYLLLNLPVYRFFTRYGLGWWSLLLLTTHHLCAVIGGGLAFWDRTTEIWRIKSRGFAKER